MKVNKSVFVIIPVILLFSSLSQSADFDLKESCARFDAYMTDCVNQLKVVQVSLEKYQNDNQKYEIYLDLSYDLEILCDKILNLRDMYYLFYNMKSCGTNDVKMYIFSRGTDFIQYYQENKHLDIIKNKLDYLKKNKMDAEYLQWKNYIERQTAVSTIVENSINHNFK